MKNLHNADRPQIYVYLTNGGILDWQVTRGDIDVITFDWDENMERTIEDWEDAKEQLAEIADPALRRNELASVDEEIEELRHHEQD